MPSGCLLRHSTTLGECRLRAVEVASARARRVRYVCGLKWSTRALRFSGMANALPVAVDAEADAVDAEATKATSQLDQLALEQQEDLEGDVFTVVLVGVTGEGKSSTGNTLCGRPAFRVSAGLCSATSECAHADYLQLGECGITRIIDTLGLQDTNLPASEVMRRFALFAESTPLGINAFLFVVRWGRFKPEHEAALEAFLANCGSDALAHMVLVFTHCSLTSDELDAVLGSDDVPRSLRDRLPHMAGAVGIDNTDPQAARNALHQKLEMLAGRERYSNEALAAARLKYDARQEEERAAFAAAVADWRKSGSGPVVIEREAAAEPRKE